MPASLPGTLTNFMGKIDAYAKGKLLKDYIKKDEICVCYNKEYEFITNVDKQTGEIKKQPLYDFVTKELTRIAKGEMSNEHLLVNDFLIDLMSFKAYYNI